MVPGAAAAAVLGGALARRFGCGGAPPDSDPDGEAWPEDVGSGAPS